tara:strand:+ start:292 stop:699 length:408 start_codon:yes stop_codon:yes gene_type:complete
MLEVPEQVNAYDFDPIELDRITSVPIRGFTPLQSPVAMQEVALIDVQVRENSLNASTEELEAVKVIDVGGAELPPPQLIKTSRINPRFLTFISIFIIFSMLNGRKITNISSLLVIKINKGLIDYYIALPCYLINK